MSAGLQLPLIPFKEVVGNVFNTVPEQMAATGVNVGTILGFTVIVSVAVVAHWPAVGVNVYVFVVVLFNTGFQVPIIPLMDVVGKGAKLSPAQIGAILAKLGLTNGFTTIVIFAVVAHCPAVGVNVYVVVVVLFKAGLQLPVILLFDVVGKAVKVAPEQIGETCVKVGTTF